MGRSQSGLREGLPKRSASNLASRNLSGAGGTEAITLVSEEMIIINGILLEYPWSRPFSSACVFVTRCISVADRAPPAPLRRSISRPDILSVQPWSKDTVS